MPRDISSLKELSAWDISKYQTAKKCYHILFVWVNIWISNQDKPKKKRHYNGIRDAMSTWSIITFLPVWTHYWQYTIQPPFISYILWSLISSLFWFCHFWHYLSQFSCAYQTERWYQVVRISDIHLIFLSISHLQFYNICF